MTSAATKPVPHAAAAPASMGARAPVATPAAPAGAGLDPFWFFAREMLRHRVLVALALFMVTVAGLTLGIGIIGARPVLENILGGRKGLPDFARDYNALIVEWVPAFASWLLLPEAWIATLPEGPRTALAIILGLLCALTVVGSTANFLHSYVSLTVVNRTITRIRRKAFHRVLRAPLRVMVASGPTDAISRIVNDSTALGGGLNMLLSKAVLQLFKGVTGLVVAIALDWRVTAGALLVAPALYTVIRRLGKRIKRASGAALRSTAGLYAAASESLQALRVVKVYTTEPYEGGRFHRINKDVLRELNRVRTARALASPLTEMLSIFLLCGLMLVGANAILSGRVLLEDFLLALGALAVAGASLKPLTGVINDIQAAAPAAERLKELLDAPAEPGHDRRLPRLARHAGSIEFRGVSLTYPGASAPALDGLSLIIRHGQRVAFVGPNGSGKTTLLGLVPRLFDPDEGVVLVDGRDIRECSVRSLRSQIGMVTQETVLFRGTIRSNIAYGNAADEAEIVEAAERARAHGFISALPQGYDTPVAEQGMSLSGGQRQRLAIARAILRDPAILILDEATSMIDADSEAQIAAALAGFSAGRTTLVVAHRLSTVLSCDSIVVLDAGRVVDQGRHEELLARCPVYRSLAQHQFAGVA